VEIRVLGPVELVAEDGPVPLGALKQRRLLSALVVHAGEARSADLLIDAIWGPSPPASAAKLLQTYVSQLRKVLPAPARIRTRGAGYALELEDESLDAARFERLLSEGRSASREENPALAASLLRRALGLWRGQAYGDFAYEEFARAEAERLEELRLVALEERIEAELALGRHKDVLPELRSLAAEHPLRERLQAQAMLAMYRCGRQSEALDLYTDARARLQDELGLEPGAKLRELQRRILQQDPGLAAGPRAEEALTRLPTPPNALLGRERELRELRRLLVRDDVRLLVLAGAGGSGKTRLALQAARETAESFANGAAFVGLAPLHDPGLVLTTIAQALDVAEKPHEELLGTLANALRNRELLLLIDNAEHLRDAAPAYIELLAQAPRLTLLVTSRAVLHLSGEHVYPVEPLFTDAAVALFLERAREAESRFHPDGGEEQAIRRICERLDGLPLAIELAASRVRTLTPAELLARLEPRLPLLTGGPRDLPARQQTLRATLEWSVKLLDGEEQRDLTRLAVFAGGCTLEAADAVCGTTVERLGSLVDHNLLRRTATADGSRYAMLETIREFALELLQAEDGAELRRRHAQYFAALSERAEGAHGTLDRAREWWVVAELDNFRAALAWTVEAPEPELASRLLAGAAGELFFRRHVTEGRRWAARVLSLRGRVQRRLEADVLVRAGDLVKEGGDTAAAAQLFEESANAYREVGDLGPLAWALANLAESQGILGDLGRAREHFEQSLRLSRELGLEVAIGHALHGLGELERDAGNFDRAAELLEESLAISQRIDDPRMASASTHGLGDLALEQADLETASGRYAEALVLEAEEPRSLAYSLGGLAAVAALRGEVNRAGTLWGALESIERESAAEIGRRERERYEARLRTLDPAELARAVADGRQLPLEVVIEEALSGR
jgi:predicted ATPase/DNA-binding SARP family transcriptional activator